MMRIGFSGQDWADAGEAPSIGMQAASADTASMERRGKDAGAEEADGFES
jgi:hypothetical protein